MECFLKIVLQVLSEIAAPCVKAFREGSKKVRELESSVKTVKKECLEWKEKYRAGEIRIQSLLKELATARWVIAVLVAALLWSMIFPGTRVLAGVLGIGVVLGSQLLPMANRLAQYASNLLKHASKVAQQIPPALNRCIAQVRSWMPDWRWKSVPISRNFRTSH
jgi:hypothetical protein